MPGGVRRRRCDEAVLRDGASLDGAFDCIVVGVGTAGCAALDRLFDMTGMRAFVPCSHVWKQG